MKYLALALLPVAALAALNLEGKFAYSHTIVFRNYDNEKSCKDDNGTWQDGLCTFEADDTVEVKKAGDEYTVSVGTVTTNGHECTFDGKGRATGANVIEALAASERYENGKFVPATCKLDVRYGADGSTASVKVISPWADCQEFCGANAMLDIPNAKRQ
jgi:hypothetical protein